MRGLILSALLLISSTANLSMGFTLTTKLIPIVETKEVEIKSDFLYSLRKLDKHEFLDTLNRLEVFDSSIVELSYSNLKRLYTAYQYDFLIQDVSDSTGFSKDFVFAYFVYEAINYEYGETRLFREHWNPGGIKAYGNVNKTYAYDDCGDKPCAFVSMRSYQEGIAKWIQTLNKDRYKKCKNYNDDPVKQCSCMYEAGYHTSPKIMGRVSLINKYSKYGKYIRADYRSNSQSA